MTSSNSSKCNQKETVTINNEETIQKIRKANQLASKILNEACAMILNQNPKEHNGIISSTDELDQIIHGRIIENNAYPSPLNYNNCPKSICTSCE